MLVQCNTDGISLRVLQEVQEGDMVGDYDQEVALYGEGWHRGCRRIGGQVALGVDFGRQIANELGTRHTQCCTKTH